MWVKGPAPVAAKPRATPVAVRGGDTVRIYRTPRRSRCLLLGNRAERLESTWWIADVFRLHWVSARSANNEKARAFEIPS